MGTVRLFATKPEDGYTEADRKLTKMITLTPQAASAAVTVRLGPKTGLLAISVTDKNTGKGVKGFKLTHITVDPAARNWQSGVDSNDSPGSSFEVKLPTQTDLIVFLSSPGYKTWFYTDASDEFRPVLNLKSGERRSLEIELEPDPAGASITGSLSSSTRPPDPQ